MEVGATSGGLFSAGPRGNSAGLERKLLAERRRARRLACRGAQVVHLSPEEREAIKRIQEMGFERNAVAPPTFETTRLRLVESVDYVLQRFVECL